MLIFHIFNTKHNGLLVDTFSIFQRLSQEILLDPHVLSYQHTPTYPQVKAYDFFLLWSCNTFYLYISGGIIKLSYIWIRDVLVFFLFYVFKQVIG